MVSKKSFSIRELILKGKNAAREYELPAGIVYVRPLSDLEMEEAQTILFDYVKDPETRKFIMGAEQEDLIKDIPESEKDLKVNTNYNINYSELYKAEIALMLRIAYIAMKDFTNGEEFEEEDLKSIRGIKGLVEFVQEISGYTQQSMEDVENFREKR